MDQLDRIRVEHEWALVTRDGVTYWEAPVGDYAAWYNGASYHTTRECALALFHAHSPAAELDAKAAVHFANGWQGNTNDQFFAAYLRAAGRPVPEYPEELRQRHAARAAEFWGAVGRAQSQATQCAAGTARMSEILEAGREEADRS